MSAADRCFACQQLASPRPLPGPPWLGEHGLDSAPPNPAAPPPAAAACPGGAAGGAPEQGPSRTRPRCLACSEVNVYIRVPEGVRAKQLAVRISRQHLSVGIQELPPYLDVRFGCPSWLGPQCVRALVCEACCGQSAARPAIHSTAAAVQIGTPWPCRTGSSAAAHRPPPPPGWLLQRDLGGPVKTDDSFWTLEDGELHIQLAKAEEGATWASAIAGAQRAVQRAWLRLLGWGRDERKSEHRRRRRCGGGAAADDGLLL